MKVLIFVLFLILNISIPSSYANSSMNILDAIKNDKNYSMFYRAIIESGLKDLFLIETKYKKTVYIPTNEAFGNLPKDLKDILWLSNGKHILKKIVRTHTYTGSIKEVFKDPTKTVKSYDRYEINGEKVKIYQNSELFVKDMIKKGTKKVVSEDIIIPVSCVMFLQSVDTDGRLDTKTKNEYNITSCCLFTDEEIKSFLNGDI